MAEMTGKKHKNILRDIQNEINKLCAKFTGLIFELSEYTDSTGRKLPMYTMGEDGWLQMGTRYEATTWYTLIDYRAMEPAWEKIGQSKFGLTYYTDQRNRNQPQYELNKSECLYIATKFNDVARAMLVFRWEKLERGKAAINGELLLFHYIPNRTD